MEGISRDIMYAVFRTQKALYRLIREDAARVGVTEVQLIVLYTLLKKEHIRLNDLAEKLNLKQQQRQRHGRSARRRRPCCPRAVEARSARGHFEFDGKGKRDSVGSVWRAVGAAPTACPHSRTRLSRGD
ncbi:hypothetical protein LR69_01036 [Geobacillus sp. BCO2]|nr:hypothetical protein LR69_01036 [Geobacillus sp. BCO2]